MTDEKIYCYQDDDGVHEFTERQILEQYWIYWAAQMVKAGKSELVSRENCIEDWVTVNWAYEKGKAVETSRS